MGGARETNLTPPAGSTKVTKASSTTQIGDLRMHEKNGEVHLHDDANSKKVAVDVDKFMIAWNKFSCSMIQGESMMLVSNTGKHAAVFTVKLDDVPDVAVTIIEVSQDTNLAKINAFIAG